MANFHMFEPTTFLACQPIKARERNKDVLFDELYYSYTAVILQLHYSSSMGSFGQGDVNTCNDMLFTPCFNN